MKKLKTTVSVILVSAMLITMTPVTEIGAAKLTKPQKVTVKSVKSTYNTITIKWKKQKKSKKVKKYFVQIKKGNAVDKYKVKKNKNVLKIGGLEPGTTYKVRVRAKNAKGYGKWSKYVEISTKPFQGKTYEETTTTVEETTTPYSKGVEEIIDPFTDTYVNEKK